MLGMAVVQGTVLSEGKGVSATQQELELHPAWDLLLAPEIQLRKLIRPCNALSVSSDTYKQAEMHVYHLYSLIRQ